MEDIKTELGKIYVIFDEEKDDYKKYRITDVYKDNDEIMYKISDIDDDYHIPDKANSKTVTKDEYINFARSHILLKSEGIVSLTNVISLKNEQFDIKDIILIFFPNNKVTKVPTINQPFVVARQAVDNIFAAMAGNLDIAGISISVDTVPAGYALSDFLDSQQAISSKLSHVYKTDRISDINAILNNKTTEDILSDLYDHRANYIKNTSDNAEDIIKNSNGCLDGYCKTLDKFIEESGFYEDIMLKMGIRIVDFKLEENKSITGEDKTILSVLYGGIPICKAVPMKFSYEINLSVIKMSYLLVLDSNNDLYIVPYTKSNDEIDEAAVCKALEENENKIQERLQNVVKAYDIHKKDETILKF